MPSIRHDRTLRVKTKPEPQPPAKPTLLQRLAQALKDHDWHKHPDQHTKADQISEHKIKELVAKCVAKHGEQTVRALWAQHVPSKLPTPFGLRAAKAPRPDKKAKGRFNDPRQAYQRRKELGLHDPAGEVVNHDRIAEGLARGALLGGEGNVHTIADHLFRGDLITMDDVVRVLGERFAARVESELVRLRATKVLEARNGNTPTKETTPVANVFSFKKEAWTNLDSRAAASGLGSVSHTNIKYQGKECGGISYAARHRGNDGKWGIGLQIVKDEDHDDGNPNCPWMWMNIKRRFDTEPQAREWLQANGRRITKAYTLHLTEE